MSGQRRVTIASVMVIVVGVIGFLAARNRGVGQEGAWVDKGAPAAATPQSLTAGLEDPLAKAGEREALSEGTSVDMRPGRMSGVLKGGPGGETLMLVDGHGKRSASTRTDVKGVFRFDDVRPGRYRFELSTPERVLSPDAWIELAAGQEILGVRLSVLDVVSLVVHVENAVGQPVDGARVRLLSAAGEPITEDRTDARGSVAFARLARGEGVRFDAESASGQRAERVLPALVEPHGEVVLRLSDSISASGVVKDPDGRPVGGARIHVYRKPHPFSSRTVDRFTGLRATKEVEVQSDEHGRFELAALSSGPKVLVAVHSRWSPADRSFDAHGRDCSVAFSKPGQRLDLILRGPAGALAGATVSLLPRGPADRPLLLQTTADRLPLLQETADPEGAVAFSGLREGTVELCVAATGGAPVFFTTSVPRAGPLELHVETGAIEVRLGQSGQPLGIPIDLELENLDTGDRRNIFLQESQWTFDGLSLGPWLVRAETSTPASFDKLVPLTVQEPKAVVEVMLVASETLRGTVRSSADQTPIAGARVTLEPMDATGAVSPYLQASHSEWTRETGDFELEMPRGYFLVRAEHPRFSPSKGVAIELSPDIAPRDPLEILITPAAELTGVVRDASGQPLPRKSVMAVGRDASEPLYAETTADGSFAFSGLGAGLVLVSIEPAYSRVLELAAGQSMFLEIVLSDGRDLEGTVLLSGEPAVGWKTRVILSEGGLGVRAAEIGREGKFRLPDLPLGTHDLYVVQGEQQLRSCYHQSLSIGPEKPQALHIDIPVLKVWGRVTTASGEPAYAFLRWSRASASAYRGGTWGEVLSRVMPYALKTDSDGKYTIQEIPPGEYEVLVVNESFGTVWETRELRESGEQPDLVLQGGTGVTVLVVDAAGGAVGGAWGIVRKAAQEAHGSPLIRRADGAGRMAFQQVPFGVYQLVVQKKGYAQARLPLPLQSSAAGETRIVMQGENELAVRVRGADAKPVPLAVVLVRDAAGELALPVAVEDESSGFAWFNRTSAEGQYNVPFLGAGEYRVEVTAPDGRRAEQSVRFAGAGHTLTIELVVK